ncbi:alpha/beta fold hydrolase [Suttonella sp. R2A3]|uniref:alpha/beta fold hydrolase n=1 Tax=Suttonella sp. R2A3 TaxID=2908648 RepID=UPI001F35D83D|nr:alpha/beta hydrolase [Suttonella sp. R2A3]UJF24394.1 alpha/beta fold hydrolase [Suttonella sp. R2A3]
MGKTPGIKNRKPSKYAPFMQALKVRTPKYKFAVEIGGDPDAPCVLLIMGLGAQMLVWPNDFCQALIDAGFQVLRFDHRDSGKSSKYKHKKTLTERNQRLSRQLRLAAGFKLGLSQQDVPYDLYDMAEDVHQLLAVLNITRCHVIGMSMGGMIGQILAANYPQQVLSLGLLSSSNNQAWSRLPHYKQMLSMLARAPDKKDHDAAMAHTLATIERLAGAHYDAEEAQRRVQLLHQRKYYPQGSTRHMMAVLATGSLRKLNTHIKQPTLVVHGREDRLIPPSHGKNLERAIPQARLVLIEGMGHDIPQALVDQLAALFTQHLQEAQELDKR